jgi:peptide/nickel transport system ATP-binding protein|tara:strand:- start:70 stop:1698 length:1629 start_codon:yes stop_codon:yes gene_type:complete
MQSQNNTTLLDLKNAEIKFRVEGGVVNAVNDISFDIIKGETLAIVGESGSGKSVTARTIMKMLPKNASIGSKFNISFKGVDISNFTQDQMRQVRGDRITMIFQEPLISLNPLHKIGSQIIEVIREHKKMKKSEAYERALELLKEVQIPQPEERLNQYPHQLSGGQRQRIMIAMAIANKPDLLIADEPTTALDVTIQSQILKLLKDLQKKYGMAIMLITHDLTVVRKTSDRICVMRYGKIVERGNTEEVFSNPQHEYTKHLINSEPSGEPDPFDATKQDYIMEGQKCTVKFTLKKGNFFNQKKSELIAVNTVDIKTRYGETIGIVGESGSGKTTLGMSLIKLQELTSGRVSFEGNEIQDYNTQQMKPLRPQMQIVFQDPFSSLNPRHTVKQIIGEGLDINKSDMNKKDKDVLIKKTLNEVNLEENMLHRFPHEFSGGQRQRIAIARAIIMNPNFILLDEPTSALDLSIQAQIIELLRTLRRNHNLSYIFISHNLKVIRSLCHYILVMKDGKVIEEGITKQVLDNPINEYTKELVQSAFEVIGE